MFYLIRDILGIILSTNLDINKKKTILKTILFKPLSSLLFLFLFFIFAFFQFFILETAFGEDVISSVRETEISHLTLNQYQVHEKDSDLFMHEFGNFGLKKKVSFKFDIKEAVRNQENLESETELRNGVYLLSVAFLTYLHNQRAIKIGSNRVIKVHSNDESSNDNSSKDFFPSLALNQKLVISNGGDLIDILSGNSGNENNVQMDFLFDDFQVDFSKSLFFVQVQSVDIRGLLILKALMEAGKINLNHFQTDEQRKNLISELFENLSEYPSLETFLQDKSRFTFLNLQEVETFIRESVVTLYQDGDFYKSENSDNLHSNSLIKGLRDFFIDESMGDILRFLGENSKLSRAFWKSGVDLRNGPTTQYPFQFVNNFTERDGTESYCLSQSQQSVGLIPIISKIKASDCTNSIDQSTDITGNGQQVAAKPLDMNFLMKIKKLIDRRNKVEGKLNSINLLPHSLQLHSLDVRIREAEKNNLDFYFLETRITEQPANLGLKKVKNNCAIDLSNLNQQDDELVETCIQNFAFSFGKKINQENVASIFNLLKNIQPKIWPKIWHSRLEKEIHSDLITRGIEAFCSEIKRYYDGEIKYHGNYYIRSDQEKVKRDCESAFEKLLSKELEPMDRQETPFLLETKIFDIIIGGLTKNESEISSSLSQEYIKEYAINNFDSILSKLFRFELFSSDFYNYHLNNLLQDYETLFSTLSPIWSGVESLAESTADVMMSIDRFIYRNIFGEREGGKEDSSSASERAESLSTSEGEDSSSTRIKLDVTEYKQCFVIKLNPEYELAFNDSDIRNGFIICSNEKVQQRNIILGNYSFGSDVDELNQNKPNPNELDQRAQSD